MKVYVASSWRNEARQQAAVAALRAAGHDVYDFMHPGPTSCDAGFSWQQIAESPELRDPKKFRDEVLTHPIARAAFAKDMAALRAAEVTVLVLPCGRSAHLELGWGARHGRSVVLLDEPLSEPELMYLACDALCTSMGQVVQVLAQMAADSEGATPPLDNDLQFPAGGSRLER